MLEPDRRHLLLDALRPPPGTTLVAAVGTTFSLDLEALLLAPIAFALFEARLAETGDPKRSDPLAVMEAVRRHASRIDLFCQAGQISVPPRDRPVLALLEESVHPTSAPSPDYIFHPKVWCLRFAGKDAAIYRLLVLSRNLTFDRSWDTIVSVEGVHAGPSEKRRAQNQPLVDFIRGLPELSGRPLQPDRIERIDQLADDLIDIEWELPDGFHDLIFLPSGVGGHKSVWPERADRALVISPFLTAGQLATIAGSTPTATLISRAESLDLIDVSILDRFETIYVLSDAVDEETDEAKPTGGSVTREELGERPGVTPTGIHAKVLVADRGWDAELRSGSTNATTAGWAGNVEFDISLIGRRQKAGVEAVLGETQAGTSLFNMLAPYQRSDVAAVPESEAEKLAFRLERIARDIARLALLARIEPDGDHYHLILTSDRPLPHAEFITIKCWPVSRHSDTAQGQTPGQPVHLSEGALSLQALTSFFAFELSAASAIGPITTRIVSNARLEGAPEDRAERLLLEQLKSKGDVLRYLLFLLADIGDEGAFKLAEVLSARPGESDSSWLPQIPLLESMVRALSRHPEALAPIERLITDLGRTPEGAAILPDGLDQVWPAIWEAKNRLS